MSKNTIFQLVVGLIGGFLIIYFGNFWLFLGILLFMWGNNIMMFEKTINKVKSMFL